MLIRVRILRRNKSKAGAGKMLQTISLTNFAQIRKVALDKHFNLKEFDCSWDKRKKAG